MARPNQRERILAFINEKYALRGFPPSLSEIALHLGLAAKSNIQRQLRQLAAEGRLENLGGRYFPAGGRKNARAVTVPLLGTVAAGVPILALENLEGYVGYLPRPGDGSELFALRVKGESMIEAGILDGDIVIVEKTPVASNGDMIVALVDDEATVKLFYRENGHVRLQPCNRAMRPIVVKNVTILGRVRASLRYH